MPSGRTPPPTLGITGDPHPRTAELSRQKAFDRQLFEESGQFQEPTRFFPHHEHGPIAAAKYSFPSQAKARHELKEQIATAANVRRVLPIDEADLEFERQRTREIQQADFDRWIAETIDLRVPGNFAWLYKLYPQYTEARMQQLKDELSHIVMEYKLRYFGVQDPEMLRYKYMRDRNMIPDPIVTASQMGRTLDLASLTAATDQYIRGVHNPRLGQMNWVPWDQTIPTPIPIAGAIGGRRGRRLLPSANIAGGTANQNVFAAIPNPPANYGFVRQAAGGV